MFLNLYIAVESYSYESSPENPPPSKPEWHDRRPARHQLLAMNTRP